MGQVWTFNGAPVTTAGALTSLVTLLEGTTFCICEPSGDVRPGAAQGLFVRDTRLISRFELSISGHVPQPLAPQSREPFACTFLSRMPPPAGFADSTLLVVRRRVLNDGMHEEITLRNMSTEPVPVSLRIGVAGDFADVFEVKEGRVHGDDPSVDGHTMAIDGDVIRLNRACGSHLRGASITGARHGDAELEVSASQLTWHAVVPAHGTWSTSLHVTPSLNGRDLIEFRSAQPHGNGDRPIGAEQRLADWRRLTPLVKASDDRLAAVFAASTEDLGSLRIFDPEHADRAVIAAGAPWFMTLFGRDSLLTSLDGAAARSVAGARHAADPGQPPGHQDRPADRGGARPDPARDAVRHAGLAVRWAAAASTTAAVDATPLFVMLLGELRRWGLAAPGGRRAAAARRPGARLDRSATATATGTGSSSTSGPPSRGLANQGWKDSFDGISFADRRDRRAADRAGRGAGLRLRAPTWPGPTSPAKPGRRRRGHWAEQAAGAQGRVQPRVLAA